MCCSTMSEIDHQGRCSQHPFVQLKRRSRQGEWKALLDSCPLCAIDVGNDGDCSPGSISNSICEKEVRPLVLIPTGNGLPRRMSKVKFASAEDDSIETNTYLVTPLPKFPLPPFSCDGSEHGSSQSVASNAGSIVSTRSALKQPKYKVCEKKMQQQLSETENVTTMSMDLDIEEDSDDENEELSIQLRPIPVTPPQPESEPEPEPQPTAEKIYKPKMKHHGESRHRESRHGEIQRREKKHSKRPQIRSSSVQVYPETIRPDPEEFPCGESLGSYYQESPQSQPLPTSYTNVVFCPPTNFDDEVSAISFMESVKYQPAPYSHRSMQQQDPIAEDEPYDCINTNNYDSKGRCVNHPQVRLRKKKLFGRGWKVLMNACPDCCVDELRRFKRVESSKRRQLQSSILEHQVQGGGSIQSAPLPLRNSSTKSNCSIKSNRSIKIVSDDTSLTASISSSSGSDRSTKNARRHHDGSTEHFNMHEIVPLKENKENGVIFVRKMQWTDDNGNTGFYTGEADSQFIPHGAGSMEYDDGTILEGGWKNGRHHLHRSQRRSRSSSRSRSTRSRSQSKTRVSSRSRSSSRSSVSRSRSVSVQPTERTRSMSLQPVAR